MAEVERASSEERSVSPSDQTVPASGDPTAPLMSGWSVREHHLFVEALRKYGTSWVDYDQYFPVRTSQEIKNYGLLLYEKIFTAPNKSEVFARVVKESEKFLKKRAKRTTPLPIHLPSDEKYLLGSHVSGAGGSNESHTATVSKAAPKGKKRKNIEDEDEDEDGDDQDTDAEMSVEEEEEVEEEDEEYRPKKAAAKKSAQTPTKPAKAAKQVSPPHAAVTSAPPSQVSAETPRPTRQSTRLSSRDTTTGASEPKEPVTPSSSKKGRSAAGKMTPEASEALQSQSKRPAKKAKTGPEESAQEAEPVDAPTANPKTQKAAATVVTSGKMEDRPFGLGN